MRFLDTVPDSMELSLSKLRELADRRACHATVCGAAKSDTA